MSTDERVDGWLRDIVENADRIAKYIAGKSYPEFLRDELVRDAVERCLERIIEAAVRIGPERMGDVAADLPLHQLRGFGNRLRHDYGGIDALTVWETAVDQLPSLRSACLTYLNL